MLFTRKYIIFPNQRLHLIIPTKKGIFLHNKTWTPVVSLEIKTFHLGGKLLKMRNVKLKGGLKQQDGLRRDEAGGSK